MALAQNFRLLDLKIATGSGHSERQVAASLNNQALSAHHYASTVLGLAFVLAGTLAIAVSAMQHRRFVATLASVDLPPTTSRVFALALSLLVAGLGAALAVYLMFALH